jgi:2-succinyl-6-hydroxy-2,4-cyclohexadiene-1-carboxylate synthase
MSPERRDPPESRWVRSSFVTEGPRTGQLGTDQLRIESSGTGDPVVLLHGFTQNARAWGRFKELLSGNHMVEAVDLPGHGGSARVHADLWATAALVSECCGPADFIGYSLGGRLLLHLALARPDVVRRAVFIGATAGIEDKEGRVARVASDELIASELDDVQRDGGSLYGFLSTWLSGPLFDGLTDQSSCMSARMENTAAGLASSLRLCGTGSQEPLWERVGELEMPVLVLAGDRDERFKVLGRRLAEAIGANAGFAVVPESNHACQLERPAETHRIIGDFFSRTGGS